MRESEREREEKEEGRQFSDQTFPTQSTPPKRWGGGGGGREGKKRHSNPLLPRTSAPCFVTYVQHFFSFFSVFSLFLNLLHFYPWCTFPPMLSGRAQPRRSSTYWTFHPLEPIHGQGWPFSSLLPDPSAVSRSQSGPCLHCRAIL